MKHKTRIVPVALLLLVAVAALALAVGYARANPGDLDPTWGEEGLSSVDITDSADYVNAHVLLDDGRYVLAGWFDGFPGSFGVARYLPDGRLDPSFGDGGHVLTDFADDPALADAAWAVAARPDGGLYVIGDTCDADYAYCDLGIAAYMPDGSLDPGFSEDGLATVVSELGPTYAWPGRAIVQPDGKLVAGGVVYKEDGDSDVLLARFWPDGTPDETFGDGGVVISDLDDRGSTLQDMMALPDDQILAVGVFGDPIDPFSSALEAGYIARFNEDGSLDADFGGGNGYVVWENGDDEAVGQHAVMTPDGQLLILGHQTGESGMDCTLQRFDIDGNQDLTFGDGGLVIINSGQNDECWEMDTAPGGKVIIGGPAFPAEDEEAKSASGGRVANGMRRPEGRPLSTSSARQSGEPFNHWIARYNLDGTPDPTFGDDGLLPFSLAGGSFWNIAVQPDGRILISGDNEAEALTARFEGDDPVQSTNVDAFDPTWGWKGVALTDFDGLDNVANAQILMPDGKLVVGGWVNGFPGDFGLARYLPDGRLDPDFGDGGRVVTAFSDDPELVDAAWAISARPNGGVHLFGETCDANYDVCELAMAAYLADGSLDESFGEDGLVTTPIEDALTAFAWPSRNILQSDGKVVAGGIALYEEGATVSADIVLVRYNTDGSLDEDFGEGGIAIIDFEGKSNFPQDIVALPGDKILIVGGFTEEYVGFDLYAEEAIMARINSDGSLDSSFGGGDGFFTWQYEGQSFIFDRALVTSATEMFLAGGTFDNPGGDICTLQRFDLDGTLDTTFGDDGWVTLGGGDRHDICVDGALTADGRIALAGFSFPLEDSSRAAASGQTDNRMSARGAVMARGSLSDTQADHYDNIVAVYHPDGTPDETFGDEGLVRFSVTAGPSAMYNLSAQPDGKLLVVGDIVIDEQADFVVVRLSGGRQTQQVFMPVVRR